MEGDKKGLVSQMWQPLLGDAVPCLNSASWFCHIATVGSWQPCLNQVKTRVFLQKGLGTLHATQCYHSFQQSIFEILPQKYVDHLPGTSGQRGKKTLNGQVEGKNCVLQKNDLTER